MQITIHPYKGIEIEGKGLIEFGMSREEVRKVVSEGFKSFMLGLDDEVPTDTYQEASIRFFYNPETKFFEAVAIEAEHEVIFQDKHIFQEDYKTMRDWFVKEDEKSEVDDDDFTSYKFGVGVSAFDEDENLDKVGSILIFNKGYIVS